MTFCRIALIAAYALGCAGCGSQPPTTATLPKPIDLREAVEIDLGDLDAGIASHPRAAILQGLKIRADQKLRFKGFYTLVDESELPVSAYFHSTASPDPKTISQSAASQELTRDGDLMTFVVEIGSPTPAGGDFRLVLKAGGNRVLATGRVAISP